MFELLVLGAVTLISFLFLFKLVRKRRSQAKNIPRGSLGLPVIGESLSFLKSMKTDDGAKWINERVAKYGQVFKTSLMGSPTVIITGQAGNKFILGSDENTLVGKQPVTISAIAGKNNVFELSGARYKLIKGAMVSFLKPESLQHYVGQIDDLVKAQLLKETKGKETMMVVNFMKNCTFNVSCTLLLNVHDEPTKEALVNDITIAFKALWSLPLNLPGSIFRCGLQARSRIINRMIPILKKRKEELLKGKLNPNCDMITSLLALRDENQEPLTDEEVMDNFISLLIASHDTSAILLSLIVWKLARDPELYNNILKEQLGVLRERQGGEGKLTWSEIQKMKYTWRVAQELMRIIPPVFGSFRKAVKDIEFGGYDIPKGWQVFWAASGTHMNKEIFDHPTEFDPSRFENLSKPPFTYIPFGGGIHMCIGNEFARVETLTVIHHMVTKFEWSQLNPDEIITREPMPYPSMGLPIKLKPRK